MQALKQNPKPPFTVTIIDLMDAYHYADAFDAKRYAVVGDGFYDMEKAVALADRLFTALNYGDKNQRDWTKWDYGWDVRIYDSESSCAYRAHEKLPA